MKRWFINYKTSTGKKGIAIVDAPNANTAISILQSHGKYREEKYLILSAKNEYINCSEYRIVLENSLDSLIEEFDFASTDLPFSKRDMKNDYLYYIEIDSPLDYGNAYSFFEKYKSKESFGCTAFRKGRFFVRNLDWLYNFQVDFVIKVPRFGDRFASIGVTSYSEITRDLVNDYGKYNLLPFFLLDGINERGVFCCMNVVPGDEEGWTPTTLTTPTESLKESLCARMIPRFVVDNFATAKEAIDYFVKHTAIYLPKDESYSHYEFHFMIGDPNSLYVMEFVNNEIVVVEENNEVMTNFRLYGTSLNIDGSINYNTVSEFGAGLERFNLIKSRWSGLQENVDSLITFASTELKYTNAYEEHTSPFWYSEFVGQYPSPVNKLTVKDAFENTNKFEPVLNIAFNQYRNRVRGDNNSWHTTHTSVYDITTKTLHLVSQENSKKVYSFIL